MPPCYFGVNLMQNQRCGCRSFRNGSNVQHVLGCDGQWAVSGLSRYWGSAPDLVALVSKQFLQLSLVRISYFFIYRSC
jgi:hypothetical protein